MTKAKNVHGQWQPEKILSVSARLFWEKGYLATSVDDIAEASKMNKASIYYYFTNKASILYTLASTTMQGLIDQALPIVKSELKGDEKLRMFICNHVTYVLRNLGFSGIGQIERRNLPPKFLRLYVDLRDKYEEMLRSILKEGVEQERFRCEDIKLSSLLILNIMNSIVQWYKTKRRFSPEAIALNVHNFVSRALGIPFPRKRSDLFNYPVD